jgi:hypothetical protein
MDIQNISNILGDHNINLQNITACDINIITGREENPEVKAKKEAIASRIALLIKQLDEKRKNPDSMVFETNESDFGEMDFDSLISAIEYDNCVLFLGPEL